MWFTNIAEVECAMSEKQGMYLGIADAMLQRIRQDLFRDIEAICCWAKWCFAVNHQYIPPVTTVIPPPPGLTLPPPGLSLTNCGAYPVPPETDLKAAEEAVRTIALYARKSVEHICDNLGEDQRQLAQSLAEVF